MPQISPTFFEDSLVDALPLPACICEAPSGLIIRSNAHAVALWGQLPQPDTRIHDLLHFIRADGAPLAPGETPFVAAVADGVAEADRLAVIERRGRPSVLVSINILPLNTTGQRRGGLMVFHSATEPPGPPGRRGVLLGEGHPAAEGRRFEWTNAGAIGYTAASHEYQPDRPVAYPRERSTAVARMTRLINDLLDTAGIGAETLTIAADQLDVGRLVNDVVDAFTSIAAAKNIALTAVPAVPPVHAAVDDGRIVLVLANLVGNAIKFTQAGGRVTIRVRPAADRVQISVCDTGIGIPGNRLSSIFERFRNVSTGRRLGLGLHVSKRIVEAHGGRMWAHSVVAVGSTFYVELPVATAER
jgi:hypothetical protein